MSPLFTVLQRIDWILQENVMQFEGWSRRRVILISEDGTHPVKTKQSRVQTRMSTWLNMAEWVRCMAR